MGMGASEQADMAWAAALEETTTTDLARGRWTSVPAYPAVNGGGGKDSRIQEASVAVVEKEAVEGDIE